jgi:aryl-alcohol dehydrogenase-like predicted oxidoreductase
MLPRRPFGRTGHDSSRVIFGAAALGAMTQARADQTLQTALELGINHIDTAASYGDSELRLRPFLADHRGHVFLATKTDRRDGAGARRQLEQSLERMGVDHVDLVQLHNLVEPDELDTAHAPGGAFDAMEAARAEGLTRFIGVTGHGTRIAAAHLSNIERHDVDSVLLPYNHTMMANPQYAADFEDLVARCGDRGIAVQTIKSVARRRWAPDAAGPRFSWYEPLPAGPALDRAVAFVLSRDELFLNSSSDARLLAPIARAAAAAAAAPTDDELAADEAELDISALFDGARLERI